MTPGTSSAEPAATDRRPARGWTIAWNLARIAMAALIVVATIEQIRLAAAAAVGAGVSESTAVFRLLSFFTVQSNMLAAAVLTWGAVRAFATRHRSDTAVFAVALACVTTYMLVTGLVYNLVLRAAGDADIMLGWSNDIHHIIAPAFMLSDLLIAPGRRRLPWRAIAVIVAYPVLWVAVTLIRGPHLISPSTGTTPWYPYPFLDPTTTSGGYAGVAAWVAGIAVIIAAIGLLVVLTGRLRTRKAHPRS
ncbi:Pr6Pr family membrane protein [Propionicicella superfundia]|uniref:Pr6Pr family membrane protein n=1 Tax=Propionicicella superfundia TaxID=348582 RepID=UPI0006847158|nr:Pr6Pr family membrane protein [Propionicicella superfundia]